MKRLLRASVAVLLPAAAGACSNADADPDLGAGARSGSPAGSCAPETCESETADAGMTDASDPRHRFSATVSMDSFDVPPGQEYFRCQSFANPFGRDVVVTRAESFMSAGSHHMFVFMAENGKNGPLEPCSGLTFNNYLHLSQRPHETYEYPAEAGRRLSASQGVRLQIHVLNSSLETTRTEVAVTLRAAEPEQVPVRASQIFINTPFINVAPTSPGSAGTSCNVPKDIEIFSAISHMHQNGVHFSARDSNGQLLYETNDWDHPEPWNFAAPRHVAAGSRIEIRCQYQNRSSLPLTFGESAATNEMCIFAGGYFPAGDDDDITCLF